MPVELFFRQGLQAIQLAIVVFRAKNVVHRSYERRHHERYVYIPPELLSLLPFRNELTDEFEIIPFECED